MSKYRDLISLTFIALLSLLFLAGCATKSPESSGYAEVPSMLNVLTNKAQMAVEEGLYDKGGEAAVVEYVNTKNPNILTWFSDNALELRVGVIADTAVVMVCDHGIPVYEDTYCRPGKPDKDHRNSSLHLCEITMTKDEVSEICD